MALVHLVDMPLGIEDQHALEGGIHEGFHDGLALLELGDVAEGGTDVACPGERADGDQDMNHVAIAMDEGFFILDELSLALGLGNHRHFPDGKVRRCDAMEKPGGLAFLQAVAQKLAEGRIGDLHTKAILLLIADHKPGTGGINDAAPVGFLLGNGLLFGFEFSDVAQGGQYPGFTIEPHDALDCHMGDMALSGTVHDDKLTLTFFTAQGRSDIIHTLDSLGLGQMPIRAEAPITDIVG